MRDFPLDLKTPLGLAAGYDKNAKYLEAWEGIGFGWVEVGTVTPKPRRGTPGGGMTLLRDQKAAVNNFGMNNDGMVAVAQRLSERSTTIPVGLSIGSAVGGSKAAESYSEVLLHCAPYIAFATLNFSCPNSCKIPMEYTLHKVMPLRPRGLPIFIKIAPDLSDADLEHIAIFAKHHGVDAIVATNTRKTPEGGLSGKPLFKNSNDTLTVLHSLTDTPLVGVGGIFTAQDAKEKMDAGASAIQIHTALAYRGASVVGEINKGLSSNEREHTLAMARASPRSPR